MSTEPGIPHGATLRAGGLAVLAGALLEYDQRLDALFVRWAKELQATEYRFPTFLSAENLQRLEYFKSFPHLATFPVTLDAAPENLEAFVEGTSRRSPQEPLQLTNASPVTQVMTPAACYHVYVEIEGSSAEQQRLFTTRATCFRREEYYRDLERLWSFSMREIVCVGTRAEVDGMLEVLGEKTTRLAAWLGLDVQWQGATDPFFRPLSNPKYIFQKLEPVKHEMVFGGKLAISSTNRHQQNFGEAFHLRRNDEAAFTGCIAFGIERWLTALTRTHGPRIDDWPRLEDFDV